MEWLAEFAEYCERFPIVIFRFPQDEWRAYKGSRRGTREFTFVLPHDAVDKVKRKAPCILIGEDDDHPELRFGLISSRQAISTLHTRIKVIRASALDLKTEDELKALLREPRFKRTINRLNSGTLIDLLSGKLSSYVVAVLSDQKGNHQALRSVADQVRIPKKYDSISAIQQNAVQTALGSFGLTLNSEATSVELFGGDTTAIGRVSMIEDRVIEHEARTLRGWDLIDSDITGVAKFERRNEQLEIITANRGPLEKCFGVDLIYVNYARASIVMLQYKMLTAEDIGERWDWVYRPDDKLAEEINRMAKFNKDSGKANDTYRLNASAMYLKFVKRDALMKNSSIITPLDHYQLMAGTPTMIGPRGGVRLSFDALNGNYLRQHTFQELMQSGYIGTYPPTTENLLVLINEILAGNKAVVLAIQKAEPENRRTMEEEIDAPGDVYDSSDILS
jgi:hypothetical protein